MKKVRITTFLSSILILMSSQQAYGATSANPQQVNVQHDGIIFYDATKYPDGIRNKAHEGKLQMAMDANGVMFDQDESMGTRLRLMKDLASKKGLMYTLWAAKQGFSVVLLKKELQRKGDPRGYCSDAIFLMLAEKANDLELLEILRDSTLKVVTPNIEVAHLLKVLEDRGHTSAVLSNMGNELLTLQAQQLNTKIESGKLSQRELEASKTLYKIINNTEHNVVAGSVFGKPYKPSAQSYQLFLNKNQNGQIMTVLVDDKLANIEAAVVHGFVGILCKKGKAAEALMAAIPALLGEEIFAH